MVHISAALFLIVVFRVIGQNVLVKIYIMLVLRAEYGAY